MLIVTHSTQTPQSNRHTFQTFCDIVHIKMTSEHCFRCFRTIPRPACIWQVIPTVPEPHYAHHVNLVAQYPLLLSPKNKIQIIFTSFFERSYQIPRSSCKFERRTMFPKWCPWVSRMSVNFWVGSFAVPSWTVVNVEKRSLCGRDLPWRCENLEDFRGPQRWDQCSKVLRPPNSNGQGPG